MCVDEITTAMNKRLCFIAHVSVRLIYCTSLIISFSFYAHSQEMAIRLYTAKDGLPSTYVTSTYQDKLGYLWVGTTEGLSRFDGKYFANYGLSDGLPATRTGGGFMDSRLRYWAITARGVVEFKGNSFINYPLSDSQNIHWVFGIFETGQHEILSLTNVGVYKFNLNKWWKIKLYPGYENHACKGMIETKEGIYINYGDLVVLKKPDGIYKIIGSLKTNGYHYLNMLTSGEEIFISTIAGIYKLINQQLVQLPGKLGKLKSVYAFFCDSKKRCWIGNERMGIGLLVPGDTDHFVSVYRRPENILIQDISEDKQGNIWVASGSGLIRISEKGFKILKMPGIGGKKILRNVLQPPTGPLLINTGSLTIQRLENGVFKKKELHYKSNSFLPNNELIIDNYAFDDKDRYWYYLRGFVLAMQHGNSIYVQTSQLAHLGDQVFDVLFDKYRKKILVAIISQKFPGQFNDTGYSLLNVINDIDVKGTMVRLHQCANGDLLFATDRGFVYSIDKQNRCKLQFHEFNTDGVISWFCNDPSGDVWIIYTGRGLRRYSWQNDSLVFKEQITKANGLRSDNVTAVCFDNRNNLWVCSNSDVAIFSHPDTGSNNISYQMTVFFESADLQTEGGVDSRLVKDKNGNIWFFSDRYLMCFYPGKINYTTPVSNIEIEKIELNFRQTDWSNYADSLRGIFQLPIHLQLSHENNTLGIYFKGISSSGTNGIKYSYVLEGLQNQWSDPSFNDFVSFVKLPPGKYSFKVKAQLLNTNWSQPIVFSFIINKAFWQTWWFYSLLAIIVVTGIYILFRYRLRQKIDLHEMRNHISQDLHDEIGASISGINLLSQIAAEKLQNNKPDEASEYLFKVKNYTQDVIEKLSDMVWVFNPQNDSFEKLLQRLKSFTISIAVSKNIKMHYVTDKETEMINLTIQQRKVIYLISKEAINNIFKYAACSNIYYSLHTIGSKCRLRIQDDGLGFTLTESKKGNGLKNMQARATEIGAIFNIHTQPGSGTIVTLEF